MEGNLGLWSKVDKTDPAMTKQVNQRGGFTSIDSTYQSRRATEQFGPYGSGWGLEVSEFEFSMLEQTGMVIHKATFFYTLEGKRVTFPIHNAIKPMMGTKPDEDWAKKVETNTISKALSRLGFSADVFMGMFEDASYVQAANVEQQIAKAEERDATVSAKQEELKDYVLKQLEAINSSKTENEINGITKVALRHLARQKAVAELSSIAERGEVTIARTADQKKGEIK